MTMDFTFRRAQPGDADLLGKMTLEGLYYWGYNETFPDVMEDFKRTNLPTPDYIREFPVFLAETDERIIGFYGLHIPENEDFIDLRYLFLDTDYIGKGYGKKLWIHAVDESRKQGFEKLRIVSDPKAVGFYEAMGAKKSGEHTVQPGFVLSVFWFDLTED